MASGNRPPGRTLFLLPGALALLAGLDAGLLLLGVGAPVDATTLPQLHSMLMVLGFVGTVVALERAVALGLRWGYLAPAGLGLGGVALLTPLPTNAGRILLVIGAAALVLVYVPLWRRQPADAVLVQAGGAVLATGAALLWLGGVAVPDLLPWLVGFLVLTIVGERLELANVVVLDRAAAPTLVTVSATVAAGAGVALLWPAVGYPLLGAALLGLTGWLVRYDVARRTVRGAGLPRFMAACLLTGYAWLAAAGAFWLLAGRQSAGGGYDLVVHAVFLGFVMLMIMAHAPVILPAVIRRPLPYHPVMYAPAALLVGSLLLRTVVGDLREVLWAWQWGGALNVVALLAFIAIALWSVVSAGRRARRPRPSARREPAAA
ncbi:MAG TPA: hypothetical protein VFN19_11270 [Candidatus Nanopelagicales bacterium]|nr:hypothetical protein [Candidatus Nanopelagicales bacterium]